MSLDSSTVSKPWSTLWLIYVGLFTFALFAWLPDSYTKMLDWPGLLVWQSGFLAIAVWFLLSWRQYHQPWHRLGYGLDVGIVGLGLALIIVTARAISPEASGWYLVMVLGHVVLLYSGRNWLEQTHQWGILWGLLVGAGSISACVSLALWLPQADWLNLRNSLPLGQSSFVGGYLVLLLPMAIAYGIAHRDWRRIFGGGTALLLILDLYTTAFRPALVAIALVGILSYLMMLLGLRKRFSLTRLLGSTVLLGAVLLSAGFNPKIFTPANFVMASALSTSQTSILSQIQARFLLWTTSLDILQAHPITGLGMGNLGRHLDQFHPLVGAIPETPQLLSTPLQILSELGLLGAIASFIALFLVLRLWLSVLPYVEENSQAEILLYGIGASWLGYSIVCLTDYQLENLAISTTLILTVVLLLGIAHEYSPESVIPKTPKQRRAIQLISLFVFVVTLYVGLPRTVATAIAHQGQILKQQGEMAGYEQQLKRAHQIVLWQQSYPLDLAMNSWRQEREAPKPLSSDTAQYFRWAMEAVPDDLLLRYNYGAIAAAVEPDQTEAIFTELVTENPLEFPYSYYFLAKSKLQQVDFPREQVIHLLALQILQQPDFFTAPEWINDPTLNPLRIAVYQQAIAYYQDQIEQLSPADARSYALYEQMMLLKWWQRDFLGQVIPDKLRPSVQALMFAESQPQLSLKIIEEALIQTPDDLPLQLLKTWFDPSFQFTINKTSDEQIVVQNPSANYDTLQAWIQNFLPKEKVAAIAVASRDYRYREPDLAGLSYIMPPDDLQYLPMLKHLDLFRANDTSSTIAPLILKIQAQNLSQ
ncbi:MAG: hypothetical protein HC799_13480 [Limnothrix sp. RL_2_0]|nr:hypothetical protein [Limnothrix sp. RL_2_0]